MVCYSQGWGRTTETFQAENKRAKILRSPKWSRLPGVADPGQVLVAAARKWNVLSNRWLDRVPYGLALMASGMRRTTVWIHRLPAIDNAARIKLKELEISSAKNNSTKSLLKHHTATTSYSKAYFRTAMEIPGLCCLQYHSFEWADHNHAHFEWKTKNRNCTASSRLFSYYRPDMIWDYLLLPHPRYTGFRPPWRCSRSFARNAVYILALKCFHFLATVLSATEKGIFGSDGHIGCWNNAAQHQFAFVGLNIVPLLEELL